MNKNDEKVKKALENEEVPKELEPENIKKMLDDKAPSKKRRNISVAGRLVALSAACAVIVGSTVAYVKLSNPKKNEYTNCVDTAKKENVSDNESSETSIAEVDSDNTTQLANTGSYMTGAENYEQIYTMIQTVYENQKNSDSGRYAITGGFAKAAYTAIAENGAVVNGEAFDDVAFDSAPAAGNGVVTQGIDEYSYNSIESPKSEPVEEHMETPAGEPDTEPATVPPETGADYESSEIDEPSDNDENSEPTEENSEESSENTEDVSDDEEYSDTHNQEENVLEADIVKTDGKNIYYAHNDYNNKEDMAVINYASVDKGTFTGSGKINLSNEIKGYFGNDYETNVSVQDMYLYNGMLAVLGTVNGYCQEQDCNNNWYDYKTSCFVSFYTTDETPQLIDTYYQEGNYKDVRIAPDGYMYLLTDYSTYDFARIEQPENIERYIPCCGISDDVECLPAGDILLPDEGFGEDIYNLSYTVIGSLDLTQSGTFSTVDSKALAGYVGDIYCSGSNLYATFGWEDTDITRIAIGGGNINPEASTTVDGRVKDQFSMSEYNGYFRIAVTNDEYEEVYHSYYDDETVWDRVKDKIAGEESGYYSYERTKRDNRLYVLDMDLNIVGSVEDFGIDEEIKSVNYSGDIAYVVTYEQTDPLFAIDLSDPTNPTILDEFKILGYSTYMQNWDDGMLLGFGVNADENGIENGIKLTMFDNSDPYNLDALATYVIAGDEDEWIYSEARWERKALLIAPEKNIIGVPVVSEKYNYVYYDTDVIEETEFYNTSKYMFFEYSDGEFKLKGEISKSEYNSWDNYFNRALYIGDYVYAVSGDRFISADIETITEYDRVDF